MGLIRLGHARQALESVLGSTIDLVPAAALESDVARRVAQDAVPL
jgi:predicted nucleotidyltransferase